MDCECNFEAKSLNLQTPTIDVNINKIDTILQIIEI